MIDYIKGKIVERTPTDMVLECYGIGYKILISLQTYEALNGKDDVKIYNTVATKMFEHRVFLEMASATAIACIPNHDHFIDCNHWPMKYRKRCVHMHPLKYRKKNNKQIALSRMIRRKLDRVPRLVY